MNVPDLPITSYLVICAMSLATMAVRLAGFWVMTHVPPTPFVRACLEALPGAIMISTVVPLGLKAGPAGLAGLIVTALLAVLTKKDLIALLGGLAMVAACRQFGLA